MKYVEIQSSAYGGFNVSHLQFMDDSIIFVKANQGNVEKVWDKLSKYKYWFD